MIITRSELSERLKGVKVKDIAQESGLSTKTIYRLRSEANPPNYGTIERLLLALKRLEKHHPGVLPRG